MSEKGLEPRTLPLQQMSTEGKNASLIGRNSFVTKGACVCVDYDIILNHNHRLLSSLFVFNEGMGYCFSTASHLR